MVRLHSRGVLFYFLVQPSQTVQQGNSIVALVGAIGLLRGGIEDCLQSLDGFRSSSFRGQKGDLVVLDLNVVGVQFLGLVGSLMSLGEIPLLLIDLRDPQQC